MIESINNATIKKYSKLLQKKYRDETGLYIVSTDHLVKEAINKNIVVDIFLLNGCNNEYGKVTFVTEPVMRKLTNLKTLPNVIAIVKKQKEKSINGNVIMLDGLQDPGNVGTIIRSAVAFNFDTIIVGKNTVDIYNEKVLRASEGMIYNINIIKSDLIDSIMDLKLKGYMVLGTRVDNGKNIESINSEKYAFIVGNEGSGISEDVLNLCDDYVYIPISKTCESLNVGIASSIIMYEINRKL